MTLMTEAEALRGNRRFWTCEDVENWVKTNDPAAPSDLTQAAIWWCCYRNAESIMESLTVKELARMLNDGTAPIDEDSDVTDMVQQWCDENGDEGDRPGIDDAIEANLRQFFIEGR